MPLSWNEIWQNAIRFAQEWAGEGREEAEAKSFWDGFFQVFGLKRRVVASFEEPVKNLRGQYNYIDLFWPGLLLVEHKSRGKDLDQAQAQAFHYIQDLVREGRHDEVPRYVIVSDFARFALHDLEPEPQKSLPCFDRARVRTLKFPLTEFHQHVREFAFIIGQQARRLDPEDPANERAYRIMADLHDALEHGGFTGHELERFLVRVLFCLFADDTGIFEPCAFQNYLEGHTREDGSDLGAQLNRLFDLLNTPEDKRQESLAEDLAAFPYVNGELFRERLGFADFNRDMRNALLACCRFSWARISPAVFGSLFQGIMEPAERRRTGGHYTSERDILKVIRPLFLDALRDELDAILADRSSRRRARLEEFQQKLRALRFLDPACGCGNFLVLTYRELRRLELEALKALYGDGQQVLNVRELCLVDVDQFFGIEIAEWPARIAEVAMWLMDHQMNVEVAAAFGLHFRRLPLRASPHIILGNALRLDWRQILPPAQCAHVLGNPPFIGAKFQTDAQRADMDAVAGHVENSGLLDYVTGWYFKAAEYIRGTPITVGFVSTNSICQGEQAGVLWNPLFQQYRLKIHFGHRTFAWESEARGKAHVHVVIVGFGCSDVANKRLYDTDEETGNAIVFPAQNISPYLVEGPDRAIINRSKPLCDVPEMGIGNKPIDGGNYLFTPEQKAEFIKLEPASADFFRRWIGSEEFINGIERWCLWLGDCPPAKLRQMPHTLKRVENVRQLRLASKSTPTRKLAATPTRFHVENMPKRNYLVVPKVSSERRAYIPIGFVRQEVLSGDALQIIPHATLFHFGVLSSAMHMAWVRQVCGRLKSDYRYSNKLVYNNFPWPAAPTEKEQAAVEAAAQRVLDLRVECGDGRHGYLPVRKASAACTLADLYDPLTMPAVLARAHRELDRAVDRCYRPEPFTSERQRVEYLFRLYEELTAPLTAAMGKKAVKGKRKTTPQ